MLAGRPELQDMGRCRGVPEHSHAISPTHTLSPLPHTKRSHHMHPTHRAGLSPSWAKLGISGIHLHHKWQIKMNGAFTSGDPWLLCMGHDTMQPFTPCNAMQSGAMQKQKVPGNVTQRPRLLAAHGHMWGQCQCKSRYVIMRPVKQLVLLAGLFGSSHGASSPRPSLCWRTHRGNMCVMP